MVHGVELIPEEEKPTDKNHGETEVSIAGRVNVLRRMAAVQGIVKKIGLLRTSVVEANMFPQAENVDGQASGVVQVSLDEVETSGRRVIAQNNLKGGVRRQMARETQV